MEKKQEVAVRAAKKAGAYLKNAFTFQATQNFEMKEHFETVSDVDKNAEEIIVNEIKNTFPDDKIMTEETPDTHKQKTKNEHVWIIDPLDGTTNFLHGFPVFCVSIAYMTDNDLMLGVVYDPIHENVYSATQGQGTTLNNQPISVSNQDIEPNGLILTGRWHLKKDKEKHTNILKKLEPKTPHLRRWGSAALMLAHVASGQAESVILTGSKLWDVAAGVLLIKESGGVVSQESGESWEPGAWTVVGSNNIVHKKIISLTK